MSVQAEFLLIALALFVWESLLWLPMRSVVLKRRWRSAKWSARTPGDLFATRHAGVLPLLPAPLEGGFAPCQSLPLFPSEDGGIFLEAKDSEIQRVGLLEWDALGRDGQHLLVTGKKASLSSPRVLAGLSAQKESGLALDESLRREWMRALSHTHAAREWRRWRLVSMQLRCFTPLLTFGFFVGLPLLHLYTSLQQTLIFGAWLWLVMAFISSQLWWLGKRVYPEARNALRMDSLLSLLVPFHAMRAAEIASLHAFARVHPAALVISTGDLENPWFARFARRILFPGPDAEGDAEFSRFIRPLLEKQVDLAKYDIAPAREDDEECTRYCPRCHSLFLSQTETCADCRGVRLRSFN